MDESQTIRVKVEEAATLLGVEKGSVKKRIQRGKLRSEKDATGTLYVYVDRSETVQDSESSALVSELRDRLRCVEGQLEAERQAHAEACRLLAAALERIPAIEAPQEASEAAERVEEEPERAEPRPSTGEDREPAWRRWRRRLFSA